MSQGASPAGQPSSGGAGSSFKLPPWLVIVLIVGFLGFSWWQNSQRQKSDEKISRENQIAAREALGSSRGTSESEGDDPQKTEPTETISTVGTEDPTTEINKSKETKPEGTSSPKETVPSETEPKESTPTSVGETKREPSTGTSTTTAPAAKPAVSTGTPTGSSPKSGPLSDRINADKTNPDKSGAKPNVSGGQPTKPSSGTTVAGTDPSRPGTSSPSNPNTKPTSSDPKKTNPLIVENQTIRNYDKVVYKGAIDLQPTLDRIARGEKNSHRNDGSTFGNRERRLPQKPNGYYTEYVHPTKGVNGPGPQRIIMGKNGDIWYTPDHYESFKKIK